MIRFLQPDPLAQPAPNGIKSGALHIVVLVCGLICFSGLALAQTAEQYMSQADRQYAAQQYKDAIPNYLKVVELEPDNGLAYHKLATAYRELHMFKESAAAGRIGVQIYARQAAAQDLKKADAAAPAIAPAPIPQALQPQQTQPVAGDPQSCPTQIPPGTVTRNSPASPQTFQRVIYDVFALDEHGQLGLVFTQFQMQPTRKNTIVRNGGQPETEYPNVPEGATTYPIKTTYVKCVQDASLAVRTVWAADYICMKDKFGDWGCPTNSTAERLDYKLIQKQ